MKKVFLTLAVTAVSVAAMSMVAFADPSLAVDKTTATVSGVEKGDYVSLLIVKSNKALAEVKDEDILYVDQATAGEDGTASFTFPEITGDSAKGAVVYSGYSSMTAEAAPLSKNYQAGGGDEPGPSVVYGELDGNDGITLNDAIIALKISTGSVMPTAEQKIAADVDGVEGVTLNDAILILKKSTGSISKFPIEE